jgi:hypothetical protein
LAFLLAVPTAVWAQDDPYAGDPLGLIAFAPEVTQSYAAGADVWEVWVCEIRLGPIPVDPAEVVELLNATVTPYFVWLSGVRYRPVFEPGGVVQTAGPDPTGIGGPALEDCERKVAERSTGAGNGALIVTNTRLLGGYALPGLDCLGTDACPTSFPDNGRLVMVGGPSVVAVAPYEQPIVGIVAHELGHALNWPHSFSGETIIEDEPSQYDNPMDLMSAPDWIGLEGGTIAINRYAAGWIDPASVAFHRQGTFAYRLGSTEGSDAQMLVLPNDAATGSYDVLGARVWASYDAGLPTEGVEVYQIDQRSTACQHFEWEPSDWPCFGVRRRTQQVPPVGGGDSLDHVHSPGETFTVRNVTIEVLERTDGVFTLLVSGAAVAERFDDDNGNLHEANIETIAGRGITMGCNPPINDRYCPNDVVSRAQMAAFLLRTMGEDPLASYRGYFPDVAPGSWYTGFVERAFELGLTQGYPNGTFRPETPVARSQVAAFILRALGEDLSTVAPTGVFFDVPLDAWYREEVERLKELGITTGCGISPLRYCPGDPVKRDQMGSLLARTLQVIGG